MESIESRLKGGETIISRTKCHYAVFGGPLLLIFIGGLVVQSREAHAIALIGFGVVYGIFSYLSFCKSEIGLTQTRLLMNAGFPLVRSVDIPLDTISAVDYGQPALGAILNFGKLMIVTGERQQRVIRFVAAPAIFAAQVREQITLLRPPQDAS
jgi:uncharacterized membrane protein YdbT with pleckstrin-like domain